MVGWGCYHSYAWPWLFWCLVSWGWAPVSCPPHRCCRHCGLSCASSAARWARGPPRQARACRWGTPSPPACRCTSSPSAGCSSWSRCSPEASGSARPPTRSVATGTWWTASSTSWPGTSSRPWCRCLPCYPGCHIVQMITFHTQLGLSWQALDLEEILTLLKSSCSSSL